MSIDQAQDVEAEEVETREDTGALADIMAAVEASEKAAEDSAREPPAKSSKEAPESDATQTSAEETPETVKTEAEKGHDPLATWKQADKERFKELTPAMQEFVLGRERERNADYTKKVEEIATFRKEYGAVDEMFTPYKAQMSQAGLTPYGIIQAWRNVEQALMDGRGEQVIRDIAKNYKIDLSKVVGATAQNGELTDEQRAQQELQAILNPFMSPVQKELEAVKQQLAEARQFQTNFTNSQQSERVNQVQNEILTFANATDAAGGSLHPYFKDVEEDMGMLAQACKAQGKPVVLQELYDRAVWANTSTRERLLKAQQPIAAVKTPTEEARAKSVASRRAGSSVTGSAGLAQIRNGSDKNLSVREALEAAFEESQG